MDLEANGRFAYKARVCTLQLAWDDEVAIVDALSPVDGRELHTLQPLFGPAGPTKVIHDVGFDARLLAEVGLSLGNVHDTALLAQWLGRPATGLASLALAELGVTLDKSLQAQDWGARPLTARSLVYLEADVANLLPLDTVLWEEAVRANITEEVLEETNHRLRTAEEAVRTPDGRPPFARVKGAEDLDAPELVVLRHVAEAREQEARRLNAPAAELVPAGVLVAIARAKPRTLDALAKVRRPIARIEPDRVAAALVAAVASGLADQPTPADRTWFERPRMPAGVAKERREREARLSAWRKAEATTRKVVDQVVLPGHCAADVVALNPKDLAALASVPGIGPFRVERYGVAILRALQGAEAS